MGVVHYLELQMPQDLAEIFIATLVVVGEWHTAELGPFLRHGYPGKCISAYTLTLDTERHLHMAICDS